MRYVGKLPPDLFLSRGSLCLPQQPLPHPGRRRRGQMYPEPLPVATLEHRATEVNKLQIKPNQGVNM